MRVDIDSRSSTDPTGVELEGDTPRHQFHLRSRMNLPYHLELDTTLYFVSALKSQPVRSYTRFDLRLGWRPTDHLELSLVGQNLFEKSHEEFATGFFSQRTRIPRSVYGMITFRR